MGLSRNEKRILLKRKRKFLKHFSTLKKKDQIKRLNTCSDEEIHTICEAYFNLLKGTLPLDIRQKKKIRKILEPIKVDIRKLANSKINVNKKRKILSKPQVGGGIVSGLATLMGILLPTLLSGIKK